LEANANLSRQPQSIDFAITAQDAHDRRHNLLGTIDFPRDALRLRLNQASLGAPDGAWKLLRPATVTKENELVSIEQFALKNGDREVSANGSFALSGRQDLSLNIDRLPVESLTGFLSQPPKLSGLLAMRGRIAGTAAAPEVRVSAQLNNATVAGQAYAGADAEVEYKDKQASLRFTVRQDSSHTLNGTGRVPLNLGWQNGWRADFGDGLEARAQSAGLSVGF
jgi:autotransporter translocation and assembly factor TamB